MMSSKGVASPQTPASLSDVYVEIEGKISRDKIKACRFFYLMLIPNSNCNQNSEISIIVV